MNFLLLLLFNLTAGIENPARSAPSAYLEGSLPALTGTLNIKVQPSDQADCKGNKAVFSVTTEGGTGKIHYFWKRKRPTDAAFAFFGAADSIKLPVYNIGVGSESPDGTLYQVSVSDTETEITSSTAHLTVNEITGIAPIGVASYTLNQGENLWLMVETSGNSPSDFQWIRKSGPSNWQDVTDSGSVSGSHQAQLNFTKISPADSGIYKVRVTFPTINGNQCTETSTITRRINVIPLPDTEPPNFVNLSADIKTLCPDDLIQAEWNNTIGAIPPDEKITCMFHKSDTLLDLLPSNFSDNITPSASLVLHWGIFSDGNFLLPLTDAAGTLLDDRKGQISIHPENIIFEALFDSNQSWQVIFWLEDAAGNLTSDSLRLKITIKILRRPEIVSNF